MKIPSYIWLFVFTVLIALGCAEIGSWVLDYAGGQKAIGVLVSMILFIPTYAVLLRWHRRNWETRDAA